MMSSSGLKRLADSGPGEHVCWLYETEEEHRAVLASFLRQGLERGEKVLYLADSRPGEAVLSSLGEEGLEAEPSLSQGQLRVVSAEETYLPAGAFDPEAMLAFWGQETQRALSEGYLALRVTGEMSWSLEGRPGSERLIEYEGKLTQFLPGRKCLALCQYDRRRFEPALLLDVLATHPVAVVGTKTLDKTSIIFPSPTWPGRRQPRPG